MDPGYVVLRCARTSFRDDEGRGVAQLRPGASARFVTAEYLRLRHPGRSRSEAEAQTRDPCLGRCRKAGRRRRGTGLSPSSRPTASAEAWIPDTSSFAALGRRSGMTKVGGWRSYGRVRAPASSPRHTFAFVIPGEAGAKRRRRPGMTKVGGAQLRPGASARFVTAAYLRLRHPGRSRSEAEAQTRDPCLGRCRKAGRRRRGGLRASRDVAAKRSPPPHR
jgi:hypothetical protein